MAFNQCPRLSPNLFMQLSAYAEFNADFHRVYIQARKDQEKKWHPLPYLVSETDVQEIVGLWLIEWCAPSELDVGTSTGEKSFAA